MKAVMLVAGIGARLGEFGDKPPKVLLEFGGKTLLRRHVENLRRHGIEELVLGTGYQEDAVAAEIDAIGAGDFVRMVHNARFHEGSMVTLAVLSATLRGDQPVLLMDGDVLYDDCMIERLLASRHDNCFLLDRDFEPGDEPVKLCLRKGGLVEFRKWISTAYDDCGESVGFFKFSPRVARLIGSQACLYVDNGGAGQPYEEAVRDVLLTEPGGTFGYEDVTGVPWIEIDFPADVVKARTEILPALTSRTERREP